MALDKDTKEFRKLFDLEWQRRFVYILYNSEKAAGAVLGTLKPYYFQNKIDAHVIRLLLDYLEKHQEIPLCVTIKAKAKQEVNNRLIDKDELDEVLKLLDETFDVAVSRGEVDEVIDNFVEFSRTQLATDLVIKAAEKLDSGTSVDIANELNEMFAKLSLVGTSKTDLGIEIVDLPDLFRQYGDGFVETIHTNAYPQIDNIVGDGFALGGLYTILGAHKGGKTTVLVNLASSFMWAGKNIVHITLEVSKQSLGARYAARMLHSGVDWHDVPRTDAYIDKFEERLKIMETLGGGRLIIQEYPSLSFSITDLKGYLMMLKVNGFDFDVLILDYPEEMARPNRNKKYEEIADIFRYLRGISQSEGIITFAASQANREGLSKFRFKSEHIASSIDKAAVSDAILAICRTEKEDALGLARIYQVIGREGSSPYPVWVKADFSRCKMVEIRSENIRDEVPGDILAAVYGGERKEEEEE